MRVEEIRIAFLGGSQPGRQKVESDHGGPTFAPSGRCPCRKMGVFGIVSRNRCAKVVLQPAPSSSHGCSPALVAGLLCV